MNKLAWVLGIGLLLLGGCEPDLVLIDVTGTLFACGDPEACEALPEAEIELFDYNTGVDTAFIEAATDADGAFELAQIPGNSVVYMVASDWETDRLPTSFVGVTGTQDGELPDGSLFALTLAEVQGSIDDYAAVHPTGDDVQTLDPMTPSDGGIARGRFLTAVSGADSSTWPGTRGLSCYFEDSLGLIHPCVYLDHNGEPDWSLETSTTDGGWAAFDLTPGEVTGVLLDGAMDEAENYVLFTALAVEDGIIVLDTFTSPF